MLIILIHFVVVCVNWLWNPKNNSLSHWLTTQLYHTSDARMEMRIKAGLSICCSSCARSLRWLKDSHSSVPSAIPMAWRQQKNHLHDWYLYLNNISGFSSQSKHCIQYLNLLFTIWPIPHNDNLQISQPLEGQIYTEWKRPKWWCGQWPACSNLIYRYGLSALYINDASFDFTVRITWSCRIKTSG